MAQQARLKPRPRWRAASVPQARNLADTYKAHLPLEYQQWYMGAMPKELAEQLLLEEGSFLVRLALAEHGTKPHESLPKYIISTRTKNECKHHSVIGGPGRVRVEGGPGQAEYASLQELICHLTKTKAALCLKHPTVRLLKSAVQPPFLLNRRHVKRGQPLGQHTGQHSRHSSNQRSSRTSP